MSTKIASLYAEIGADTSKLRKGLGETKTGLSDVAKSALSTTAIFAAMSTVLVATGKAFKKMVDDTVDYGMQVRDLSLLIGASSEEASKLIQAADDVFISVESLSRGMQIAIRNGIEPTIEGMGALADQYNGIQDPIARTKFLLDTFGRSGAELAPLMQLGSAGITELGDSAEKTGLVMSDKAVKASIKYKEALDNLNDTVDGIKTRIGLLGTVMTTEVINNVMDLAEATDDGNMSLVEFLDTAIEGYTVLTRLTDAREADLKLTKEQIWHYDKLGINTDQLTGSFTSAELSMIAYALSVGKTTKELEGIEEAELDAAKAADEYRLAIEEIGSMSSNFAGIVGYAMEYTDIQQEIKDKQFEINLLSNGMTLEGAYISASDAAEKIKDLQGEVQTLEGDLKSLANTFALEMAMSIITADGMVTEAERLAYWAMAIDLGVVTQEAANAAETAFSNAFTNAVNVFSMSMPTSMNVGINFIAGPLPVFGPAYIPSEPAAPTGPVSPGPGWVFGDYADGKGGFKHWRKQDPDGSYSYKKDGGYFNAGDDLIVGEAGPERVKFNRPGYVVPNDELGGSGEVVRLLQQIAAKGIDESKLARMIRDAMLQVVG